jgi:predicted dehydrogenase
MADTLKFGVIGIKGRGGGLAKEAAAIEGVDVVAVADLDTAAAGEIADPLNATVHDDYQEMLAETALDVAVIATPHRFHAPMGLACLEAGLHTFLEKPIANTVSEADRLVEAAESRGLTFGIGHNYRTFPGNIAMKALVDEIAPIHRVLWQWLDTRPETYYDRDVWRCTWADAGGGVLMNQTSHDLDLLCWMMGEPVEVSAMIGSWGHRAEIEDTAVANIRFASGAIANVQLGMCDRALNYRQVSGDNGVIEFRDERNPNSVVPDSLRVGRYGLPMRSFIAKNDGVASRPDITWEDVRVEGERRFPPILPDFVSAIREGREPVTSGASARVTLELINAIVLASFTRETVRLPVDRDAYDALFSELSSGQTCVERWGG